MSNHVIWDFDFMNLLQRVQFGLQAIFLFDVKVYVHLHQFVCLVILSYSYRPCALLLDRVRNACPATWP